MTSAGIEPATFRFVTQHLRRDEACEKYGNKNLNSIYCPEEERYDQQRTLLLSTRRKEGRKEGRNEEWEGGRKTGRNILRN